MAYHVLLFGLYRRFNFAEESYMEDAARQPTLSMSSYDLPVTPALEEFMSRGWAPSERSDLKPADFAPWTAQRRARLAHRFPGERLIIPAGTLRVRSNDQDFPFRPHSAYVWTTGDQTSDSVLVMECHTDGYDATVYLRPRAVRGSDESWRDRRYGEFWAGKRPSVAECQALLDVECRHIEELPRALSTRRATRVLRGVDPSVDELVTEDCCGSADNELASVLSELRLVKDAWEIDQLTDAVQSTERGFEDVVREWPAVLAYGERWIEGTFWRRARLEGNDAGYGSIVAAGQHATTLHWRDNDGPVQRGQLILMDMGVENRSLYTADITRTLPVSGTFTSLQRDLYTLVYEAQSAGIAAVRPGAHFRDFHHAAVAVIAHGLEDLGILPCSAEAALDPTSTIYRRWTLCGTGHMLGLDVHDCARARAQAYTEGTLEPGHVLTVEPGLYLQNDDLLLPEEMRGIGIRIEDDLAVTEDGARLLSASLPRHPDEVEQWMADIGNPDRASHG